MTRTGPASSWARATARRVGLCHLPSEVGAARSASSSAASALRMRGLGRDEVAGLRGQQRQHASASLSARIEATTEPSRGSAETVANGLGGMRSVPDLVVAPLEPPRQATLRGLDLATEEGRGGGTGERGVATCLDDDPGGTARPGRGPPIRSRRGRRSPRAGRPQSFFRPQSPPRVSPSTCVCSRPTFVST